MATIKATNELTADQIDKYIKENLKALVNTPLADLIVKGYFSLPVTRDTIPFYQQVARKISKKIERLYAKPNLTWDVFRQDVLTVYDNPGKIMYVGGKNDKWTAWFPKTDEGYLIITNHRDKLEILVTASFEGVFFQVVSLEGIIIEVVSPFPVDQSLLPILNFIHQNNRGDLDNLWSKLTTEANLLEITSFPQHMSVPPITECYRGFLWVNFDNQLCFLGKILLLSDQDKKIKQTIYGDVFPTDQSQEVLSSLLLNPNNWQLRNFEQEKP